MWKFLVFVGLLALGLVSPSIHAEEDGYAFGFSPDALPSPAPNYLTINNAVFTNTSYGSIHSPGYLGGNYISGAETGIYTSNYFDFDLAGLTGPVTSASFNVDTYLVDAIGVYYIYATTLTPAQLAASSNPSPYYSALTSGDVIGVILLTPDDSNTLASFDLTTNGDTWLQSNEGNDVVVGGDFNVLPFGASPEPSSFLLLGTGVAALAGLLRRKIVKSI
jgi:hypothetical protein